MTTNPAPTSARAARGARATARAALTMGAVLGLTIGLAACSDESKQGDAAAPSAAASDAEQPGKDGAAGQPAPAPTSPLAERLLPGDAAPAGLKEFDLKSTLGALAQAAGPSPDVVEPAECAPLAFDTQDMVTWSATPDPASPVRAFTSPDDSAEGVAVIRLQQPPVPVNLEACGTAERFNPEQPEGIRTTYRIEKIDVDVPDVQGLTAVKQTVDKQSIGGQDLTGGGKIGQEITIITGEVNGTQFTAAAGSLPQDVVVELARKQVERLRG